MLVGERDDQVGFGAAYVLAQLAEAVVDALPAVVGSHLRRSRDERGVHGAHAQNDLSHSLSWMVWCLSDEGTRERIDEPTGCRARAGSGRDFW
ncbi:hypothetical protein GCM10023322_45470 [Rugosimonospora acidiphila]|uniref:Uncharacterized protein n=1 Tax=Rugosimonospora acidiphila TaxID=556531 RepID=A0ABP9S2X9_9ACTN